MHQLDEDMSAVFMHGRGHLLPTGDMRGSVNARRRKITLSVIRWLGSFGDDQAEAGALCVILGSEVSRRSVGLRAASGHWSHDQTVWQSASSDTDGRECLLH